MQVWARPCSEVASTMPPHIRSFKIIYRIRNIGIVFTAIIISSNIQCHYHCAVFRSGGGVVVRMVYNQIRGDKNHFFSDICESGEGQDHWRGFDQIIWHG